MQTALFLQRLGPWAGRRLAVWPARGCLAQAFPVRIPLQQSQVVLSPCDTGKRRLVGGYHTCPTSHLPPPTWRSARLPQKLLVCGAVAGKLHNPTLLLVAALIKLKKWKRRRRRWQRPASATLLRRWSCWLRLASHQQQRRATTPTSAAAQATLLSVWHFWAPSASCGSRRSYGKSSAQLMQRSAPSMASSWMISRCVGPVCHGAVFAVDPGC